MRPMRFLLLIVATAVLTGCGFFGGTEDPETRAAEALKLPPDMELERGEAALSIPEREQTATASGSGQLLASPDDVDVKRAGTTRWLQVAAPPARVWGWLPGFLKSKGIEIERQRAEAGIIESEWVYTKKPLTRGPFAPQVGGRESATAADRYLLRVERGQRPNTTEVFVAHRRAARQGQQSWRLLARDPFLEAEVLRSLAVFMGAEIQGSMERVADADSTTSAELERTEEGELRAILASGFFDAWRRVGLGLDRAGFTVIERNRDQRYVDMRFDTREARRDSEAGFFESLAFWRSEDIPETVRRLRLVFRESQDGRATQLALRSPDGEPVSAERREEILGVLVEEIR